jgi:hypothetical protein
VNALRRISGSAAALALCGLSFAAGASQASPKLTECQHPLVTGEEAYNLHDVGAVTACTVVRALGRWETHPISDIRELYACVGAGHHTPELVLHSFDGWKLSLTPDFRMSRGSRSFDVTGTDFPVNCS